MGSFPGPSASEVNQFCYFDGHWIVGFFVIFKDLKENRNKWLQGSDLEHEKVRLMSTGFFPHLLVPTVVLLII